MITFPLISTNFIHQGVSEVKKAITHLITSIFKKSQVPVELDVTPIREKNIIDLLKKIGHGMNFAHTDSYMGSVLQALINIPAATRKIWPEDPPRVPEHPTTAEDSYEIRDYFLRRGWQPKEYVHGQQDPGEFLPFVLNSLSISNVLIATTASKILHTQDVVRYLACDAPEVLTIGIYGRTQMGASNKTAVIPSKALSMTLLSGQSIQADYKLSAVLARFGGGNTVNCFYETFIPQNDGTWAEYAENQRTIHQAAAIKDLIIRNNYLCIYSKV